MPNSNKSKQVKKSNHPSSHKRRPAKPARQGPVAVQPAQVVIQRAMQNPQALTPPEMLQLQHAIGNQAVSKLLAGTAQMKPLVEQQADGSFGGGDYQKITPPPKNSSLTAQPKVIQRSPLEAVEKANEIAVDKGLVGLTPFLNWEAVKKAQFKDSTFSHDEWGKIMQAYDKKGLYGTMDVPNIRNQPLHEKVREKPKRKRPGLQPAQWVSPGRSRLEHIRAKDSGLSSHG